MSFSVGLYHKGASKPYYSIKRLTHNEQLMGEDFVTVTLESPTLKADGNNDYFMVGDWLLYRGVKYVVDVPPSLQKQARVRSKGNAIVFDSVKMVNELCFAMSYVEFRDVVNGTEHYNFAARSFNFYCVDLCSFAERVKANLDRDFEDKFHIYVHGTLNGVGYNYLIGGGARPEGFEAAGKKNLTINISDSKLWDSLSNVKEEFDVNFVLRNDENGVMSLFLGANGNLLAEQHFSYGKGRGLFKFERTTDTSQAIITKLRAYGAETNMPTRYYRNVGRVNYIDLADSVEGWMPSWHHYPEWNYLIIPVDGVGTHVTMYSTAFTERADEETTKELQEALWNKMLTDPPTLWYDITIKGSKKADRDKRGDRTAHAYAGINNGKLFLLILKEETGQTFWDYFKYNGFDIFYPESGINKNNWPAGWAFVTSQVPNNMNVKCLMLPGFGFEKLKDKVEEVFKNKKAETIRVLRDYYEPQLEDNGFGNLCKEYTFSEDPTDPWVAKTKTLEKYGCREGFKVFDTKDKDYEPIYPSIQYVGDGSNKLPAQSAVVDGNEVDIDLRVDDGICDDLEGNIPQWHLFVKDPGFDPYKQKPDGASEITISFKNGMLGGREFKCQAARACTLSNGAAGYMLTLNREPDSSLDVHFPYRATNGRADFVPKLGDEFVYLDIEMPDTYVEDASMRELLPAALEALDKNCDVQYKYNLTIDDVQMARQHDAAMASGGTSLHDTIRSGDVILFGDEDLGVDYNNDLMSGGDTIAAAILIDSIEINENDGALPKYTVNLVETKVISTIQKMQKQIDSIVSGATAVSTTGGGGGYSAAEIQKMISTYGNMWFLSKTRDDEAKGDIAFQNILVKKDATVQGVLHVNKLEADTLEIMKAKHISGKVVSSPAGAIIKKVDEMPTYYELYFDNKDENGNVVNNMFAEYDMLWCEQFEVNENREYVSKVTNENASSKAYWRLVIAVGSNDDYNYMRVAKETPSSLNDIPEVGDSVVVMGNLRNADRQGVTISSPVGSFWYKNHLYKAPYECQYIGVGKNGFVMPDPVNVKSPELTVVNADYINLTSGGTIGGQDEWSIYSVDWDAEVILNLNGAASLKHTELNPANVDVSEDWEETDYPDHIGDYIITRNGYCYRFEYISDGVYMWIAVEDEVLLDIQSKISGIQQSGITTAKEFAEMWSTVISSEDGKTILAEAGVLTSTSFDEKANSWIAGVKIWGDQIDISASRKLKLEVGSFVVDGKNFSVSEEGVVTALNGRFKGVQISMPNHVNPDNFFEETFLRDKITEDGIEYTDYDYDFVDRGNVVIFEGNLSTILNGYVCVYIQLPGSGSAPWSKYDRFTCLQLIGKRFYIFNESDAGYIGVNTGATSEPINSGMYGIYELTKHSDGRYIWSVVSRDYISNFSIENV